VKAVLTRPEWADRLSVVLACCFAALALLFGLHTSKQFHDLDEVVYRDTLSAIHHGAGYYPAMRDALITKEGAPPSQIRSVRPPTEFLVLSRLPQSGWRWAVGAVYLACLLLAWRIGRIAGGVGGPVAVSFVAIWLLAASSYLYLHAELWGLPLFMGGVLALRRERWAQAAVLLALAALVRELYAVGFVAGLLWTKDRRWWWPVGGVAGALGLGHALLATTILVPFGKETPFGTDHLTWQYALNTISPMYQPIGYFFGLLGTGLATCGLARAWRHDRGARALLCYAAAMVPLTIFLGRNYWALTLGPVLACFAVEGIHALVEPRSARRRSVGGDELDESLLELADLVA
jgi:hypothetical protein